MGRGTIDKKQNSKEKTSVIAPSLTIAYDDGVELVPYERVTGNPFN